MAAGKKLKGVLGKIKENFQHKFAEKEKVSLKELGQISKFVENKEMFGLMEELNPKSEKLNKILNSYIIIVKPFMNNDMSNLLKKLYIWYYMYKIVKVSNLVYCQYDFFFSRVCSVY